MKTAIKKTNQISLLTLIHSLQTFIKFPKTETQEYFIPLPGKPSGASYCAENKKFPYLASEIPSGASGKEPACQCRRHKWHRFDPWVGKIPWRRQWQPTLVFLPGESHGHRSTWQVAVHRAAQCWTQLKWLSTHAKYKPNPPFLHHLRPLDSNWKDLLTINTINTKFSKISPASEPSAPDTFPPFKVQLKLTYEIFPILPFSFLLPTPSKNYLPLQQSTYISMSCVSLYHKIIVLYIPTARLNQYWMNSLVLWMQELGGNF